MRELLTERKGTSTRTSHFDFDSKIRNLKILSSPTTTIIIGLILKDDNIIHNTNV